MKLDENFLKDIFDHFFLTNYSNLSQLDDKSLGYLFLVLDKKLFEGFFFLFFSFYKFV